MPLQKSFTFSNNNKQNTKPNRRDSLPHQLTHTHTSSSFVKISSPPSCGTQELSRCRKTPAQITATVEKILSSHSPAQFALFLLPSHLLRSQSSHSLHVSFCHHFAQIDKILLSFLIEFDKFSLFLAPTKLSMYTMEVLLDDLRLVCNFF